MAYYKAGEIIRLNRIAVGMTQEILSEDICSVETLSRMENGHHKVKQITYKRLMERMNRMTQKNYAVCTSKEMGLLEEKDNIQNLMANHQYEQAKAKLREMEPQIGEDIISQQYLKRFKAVIRYENKEICAEKYVRELEKALALTVSDYECSLDGVYPFTEQEAYLMMNIAGGYGDAGNHEKCLRIYQMLLRCTKQGYMDEESRQVLGVIVRRNMCHQYALLKRYGDAIELLEQTYQECLDIGYEQMLPILCGDIAWNMMQQMEAGERDAQDITLVKRYLRRAYYAAAAKNAEELYKNTKQYWSKNFEDSVELV